MKLERFCMSDIMGTFGKLTIQGRVFWTVEKPWNDNEPFTSCVPLGEYSLMPYTSERYGQTYKLVNVNNHVYPDQGQPGDRFGIIIHEGNTVDDVTGCIAVGLNLGYVDSKWAVTSSRHAMRDLKELWHKDKPLKLTIS